MKSCSTGVLARGFGLIFCLLPTLLLAEETVETCNIDDLVDMAVSRIHRNKDPDDIYTLLSHAYQCPRGDEDFEVNFFLAVTELRLGLVADAREHAALAVSTGRDAKEKAQARSLAELLEHDLFLITLEHRDGRNDALGAELEAQKGWVPPAAAKLTDLVSRQMKPYVENVFRDVVKRATDAVADNRSSPVEVWLPAGDYIVTCGEPQTFKVVDRAFVLSLDCLKWDPYSISLSTSALGLHALAPLEVSNGANPRVGATLEAGLRLRGNTLLLVKGGILAASGTLDTAGLGSDSADYTYANLEREYSDSTYLLGVGVLQAVKLWRNIYALLGGSLTGLIQHGILVMDSEPYPLYDVTWVGLVPNAEMRVLWKPIVLERLKLGLVAGVNAGIGGGFFGPAVEPVESDFPPGIEVPEAYTYAENTQERIWWSYGFQAGVMTLF